MVSQTGCTKVVLHSNLIVLESVVITEEILYTDRALWVSPGQDLFAFASFNDDGVAEHLIPSMTGRWGTTRVSYPRPGGDNPLVSLTVMQLLNTGAGKQWRVQPPPELGNRWVRGTASLGASRSDW